jgi:hypothetical protein
MMLISKYTAFTRNLSRFSPVLLQQAAAKEATRPKKQATVKEDTRPKNEEASRPKNEVHHDGLGITFKKLQINDKTLSNLILTM